MSYRQWGLYGPILLRSISSSKGIRQKSQSFFRSDRPPHVVFVLTHLPFLWIDPDERTSERFSKVPDRRNGLSGADFQCDRSGYGLKPLSKGKDLLPGSASNPLPVSKHQDIRSGGTSAGWAGRREGEKAAGRFIDLRSQAVGLPDIGAAGVQTLKEMDGSVTFDDPVFRKPCLLELSVHIACKNKKTPRKLFPEIQDLLKADVGISAPIEIQAVAIKSPRLPKIVPKGTRVRHVFKRQARPSQGGIGPPESMSSAKIRKSRINPHARSGSDHETVRLSEKTNDLCQGRRIGHFLFPGFWGAAISFSPIV